MINSYEKQNAKLHFKNITLLVIIVHIFALLFFTMVANFERKDLDSIFQSGVGIISLASTITLSVMTIYGIYVLNRKFIIRYIGACRDRSYIYPFSRESILKNKLLALVCRYTSFFYYLCLLNIGYIVITNANTGCMSKRYILFEIVNAINISISSVLVSVLVLLSSILIGLKKQSINISLITTIILITLLGNIVARIYIIDILLEIIINIIIFIMNYILFRFIRKIIIDDDTVK